MKKILRLALCCAMLLGATSLKAQQPKFGYINIQEVVTLMPEMAEAEANFNKLVEEYSTQMEDMQVEFNNKYEEFSKNASTYTDAVRQAKESDLQALRMRIEQFSQTAQQDLAQKEQTLLAPIYEKAANAVEKIGRDNGFTAIFNNAAQPMVYYDANAMIDVLPLVKKELGITDAPAQ